MKAHYFEHVPFEGLGSMERWLRNAGYEIGVTRWYAGECAPADADLDLLIVMGGPMSVNDQAVYPWLSEELAFIRNWIAAGRPILGVCLGAQLMARALGAKVYPNAEKEIGWFPLYAVGVESPSRFSFPLEMPVFHWHGETFDLPEGADHLARSAACAHQAFQLGRKAIGLQFHLETTSASARALIENCRDELVASAYVQREDDLLRAPDSDYARINHWMGQVLAYLT